MIRLHNNSKKIFTKKTLYTGGLFETSRGNHHVGKNQMPAVNPQFPCTTWTNDVSAFIIFISISLIYI